MVKRTALPPLLSSLPTDFLLPVGDMAENHPRTLIEQAYERLREDIVEGRLAPGEKLRVAHLCVGYGVGAGTLREAITRLVSDALVLVEGQRGFRVTPITLADLLDLTELRVNIELHALRQSIRHGDADWRKELTRSFEALCDVERPIKVAQRQLWETLNAQFHDALIAAHASPWTFKTLRTLSRHGERYRRYSMQLAGSARDVHAEHTAIYEAAMAGQDARAALALEMHIRATADVLAKADANGTDWQRLI
jgi:DNA-binding GntR family transcriptional regulator